ncbi:hypothetical protein [Bacillus cereus]|uniref:hypothetical protein n=1 Tax=Bacillus cereus TaxID=1396 RepID=UPI003012C751
MNPTHVVIILLFGLIVYSMVGIVKRKWIQSLVGVGIAGFLYWLYPGIKITEVISQIGGPIIVGGE